MSPIARSSSATDIPAVSAAVRDGRQVLLRPVAAEDAGRIQSFVRALSPQSRRNRFLYGLTELPRYVLQRLTQPNYPNEFGLLAVAGGTDAGSVVGMAQYALERPGRAEFSVAVADAWQRQGLGTRLFQALVPHASGAGVETLCAVMLAENQAMLALAGRLGFPIVGNPEPGLVQVESPLAGNPGRCPPGRPVPAWS
jgi:acetyltransferase